MSKAFLKLYKYEPLERIEPCLQEMDADWKNVIEQAAATGFLDMGATALLNGTGGSASLPVLGTRVPAYVRYGVNGAISSAAADLVLRMLQGNGVASGGWQEMLAIGIVAGGYGYYSEGQMEDFFIFALGKFGGNKLVSNVRASAGAMA